KRALRHTPRERATENRLRRAATELRRAWQARDVLDEAVIRERRPYLEPVRHAHLVTVLEDVAGQERLQLDVAEAIDEVRTWGAVEELAEELFRGRGFAQTCTEIREVEVVSCVPVEVRDPRDVRAVER